MLEPTSRIESTGTKFMYTTLCGSTPVLAHPLGFESSSGLTSSVEVPVFLPVCSFELLMGRPSSSVLPSWSLKNPP